MRRPISNVMRDKRVFSRTAKKSKRVNLAPVTMRGGIRL